MNLTELLKSDYWCISDHSMQALIDQKNSLNVDPLSNLVKESANIVPVKGRITYNPSEFEQAYFDLCSVVGITKMLSIGEHDAGITHQILSIASPGGTATGLGELFSYIQGLSKPVFAYCAEQCCSGALYIASACNFFACSPSSSIGSVGCYRMYYDYSGQMDNEGVKMVILQSGIDKTSFWGNTRPEAISFYQKECEKIHEDFKKAILSKRNVDVKHLEGLVYNGKDAVEFGFADANVDSLELFMQELI